MKKRRRVLISGYYGFNNSGDDAILKAIVKDFKRSNKDIDIVVLSNNPSSTQKTYDVKAINRFNIIDILLEMRNIDMLVSGGGSLLQDVTSTRSIIYYLFIIFLAKLFRKPVMIYANGIGPINKRLNRFLTKIILNKVDMITLRDSNSKETLKNIGVNIDNIFVTADPVFTLEASNEKRVKEIFIKEGIPQCKPLIGLAVREWKNSEKLKETLAKTLDFLSNNYGMKFLLIPMHYPEDLKISQEIKENTNADCYILKNSYNVEDIMGIIKYLDMIIAMRLHSLIYAATQAVPMVGLIYDPKVEGFLDMLNVDARCYVDSIEMVDLCTQIEKVWRKKSEYNKLLIQAKNILERKAKDNISMALELLKK
ncbi:CsaB protein [Caloranaerobacter azorensis H53214]|uniref:CsaB protein n=1 Tax=Caloranaerobacter azorensis H53214 TaxID=1156417 RepID=A0A096BH78_9FIRM|nr:polysaccharide pyruvyl transferase CsaB [Caloranaerobacter azorensis]KGG80515.1 CsaB protein [Caloranaerobacter azorensis H53214]